MKEKSLSAHGARALIELLDRTAINDLINRYFCGLDRRDFALLATCFTPGAEGRYDGGKKVYSGRDAIVEAMRGIAQFKFSTHLMGNTVIEVDKGHATAETQAVAFLVVDRSAGKGRILVRGLRYVDDLTKGPEGWQISRRVHTPLWQYEGDSIPPGLPKTD